VVFNYVVASLCGFSEYLVVAKGCRRRGVGRLLVDARQALLHARARECGFGGARGVFIEVESPHRTPEDILAEDRRAALDPWDRWRAFHRMGFFRTSVPYVQPPLGRGKAPVYYLDLFFAPWDAAAAGERCIPFDWVIETVGPIWRGWAPDLYQESLDWLRRAAGGGQVKLIPLLTDGADVLRPGVSMGTGLDPQ
jgi:hypothetical protein